MPILCKFHAKRPSRNCNNFYEHGFDHPPPPFFAQLVPTSFPQKKCSHFSVCVNNLMLPNWKFQSLTLKLYPHSNLWQGTTTLPNLAMFCNEITCMVDGYSRALKGCLLKAFPPLNVLWDRTWARPCSLSCFS